MSIVGGLSFVLTFVRPPEDCNMCAMHIIQLVCLIFLRMFLCSFWSSFYLWVVDVYPASKRSMALGIACFSGFLGSVISPFLQNMSRPMLLLGILAILYAIYMIFMPR